MSSFWYVCKLAPLYDASSRTVVPEGAVASIILNFPDSDASLRDETRYQVFHTVDVPKKYECTQADIRRIAGVLLGQESCCDHASFSVRHLNTTTDQHYYTCRCNYIGCGASLKIEFTKCEIEPFFCFIPVNVNVFLFQLSFFSRFIKTVFII